VSASGVQQLELDLDVLAGAQPGLADLRLVREGAQLPYLLERPALSRSTVVVFTAVNNPKRPALSRWEIQLPRAGLPLTRLTLESPTALFQRHLRVLEMVMDENGTATERTLAEADWSKTPGRARTLPLNLLSSPATAQLLLETDNGDNPPLALGSVLATYPVARLLFKTTPGPLALYYGNREAAAPRYDLALVAGQILLAEKSVAEPGAEEIARNEGWSFHVLAGAKGGILFWGALALVVVGLLVVVAKLLPKPNPPTT
jgi:hypothetical protein